MITAALLAPAVLAAFQQVPEDGRGQGLFDQEWHAERRAALMEIVDRKDAIIVLRGQGTPVDYREFRQDNNFWYFTGITTPHAVLVLVPANKTEYLLVPPVAPMIERWNGDLIDPEEAAAITGIENCLPLGRGGRGGFGPPDQSGLQKLLRDLAKKYPTFLVQKQPAENWMMSRDNAQGAARAMRADPYDGRLTREGQFAARLAEEHGVEVKDLTVTLDALRIVKTPQEVEAMRRVCDITGEGHTLAMRTAVPGDFEWQIAADMTSAFLRHGGMGAGYAAIVGSGPNSNVLHYPTNTRATQEGDLVLIDYGAEYRHYIADITRTWPVSAQFNQRQREVYQAVFDAQEAAFKECKPGSNLSRVHGAAQRVVAKQGFGPMWHGTSHFLGMATHDVGRMGARFEPGMVFTVEPGIYLPEEGFGVRIEDVVAITEDGYELLSRNIPRSVEEVEALRAEALSSGSGR